MNKREFQYYVPQGNELELFEQCYKNKIPLMLKGPTGCGKSHFVEHMAEKLQRPLVKVACNEDTNSADLLGRFLFKGGETIWQDGPVVRAIKQDAILYLDEFAEAREDVVVALHPLTDHRREVYIDKINEVVRASDSFMLVASYNPNYQQSTKEIKPSTKQRFIVVPMNYLSKEKEVEIIVHFSGVTQQIALAIATMASHLRGKQNFELTETVSTRLLIHAGKLIASGMNQRKACHYAIAEVLTDDLNTSSALKDFINLYI